MRMFIKVN